MKFPPVQSRRLMESLTLHFFWPCLSACGILVPRPGIEPTPSAVKAPSPNHWTARDIPGITYFDDFLICGLAFHRLRDIRHGTGLLHGDHPDGHGNCLSREDGGVQNLSVLPEEPDIAGSRELFSSLRP